ncbi:MAG: AAA family ATPase [Polyangiaceae bacterium]|jgi:predicted ATPase|nr:AAA family ATPase [Polyangiaceae bacterium]
MNRLEKLTLNGFKTFPELAEFAPQQINVLIGANGAGKSNFISFFRLLSWMLASTGNLQRQIALEGGAHRLLHNGPGTTSEIEAKLSFVTEKGTNEYDVQLAYAPGDTLFFGRERLRFARHGSPVASWRELGTGHLEAAIVGRAEQGDPTAKTVRALLQRCVVYQFHNTSPTSRLRGKWSASDNRYLKEDGANLASVLLRLKEQEPPSYRTIVSVLRLVIPFFDDFEFEPEHGSLLLRWRELDSDLVFDSSQASDGMLRTFALVTLLGQGEAGLPDLLILDEPELGLHPYAISLVGGMIKRVAAHSQVIVATQSPTLVDQFDAGDVVVVERDGRRSSLRRLEPESLAAWLEEYSLGELWLKNVLGGRPLR